ncbi:MAG TPA: c-type cytochrome, partial [Candidatus Limnocylindria bacterium]|nr:c-type cytochrome [Candidatus Limnocylindria bacterium]
DGGERVPATPRSVPAPPPPVRMTMDALHAAGGVPFDWKLTPPPGDARRGREVFAAYGCPSCHVVQGEDFRGQGTSPGPELTGMGAHHPPGYFVEAILNPNAIVVEGEGYAAPSGLSTMPAYPDMPLVDLIDVVAYLSSLTGGHNHAMMMAAQRGMPSNLRERPEPPPQPGTTHVVMRYDLLDGKLAAFERWFRDEGRAQFFAVDGLVAIDTYVVGGPGGALVSIFTFRDQQAAEAFLSSPSGQALGEKWDSYIGPHGHVLSRLPPVYRVDSLSGRP